MLRQAIIDDLDKIERHHHDVHRAMEKVQNALSQDQDELSSKSLRNEIMSCIEAHMVFEEEIMDKYGYPLGRIHAINHTSIRDQIGTVLRALDAKRITGQDATKIMKGMHDHHNKYYDEVFSHYLINRHVAEQPGSQTAHLPLHTISGLPSHRRRSIGGGARGVGAILSESANHIVIESNI